MLSILILLLFQSFCLVHCFVFPFTILSGRLTNLSDFDYWLRTQKFWGRISGSMGFRLKFEFFWLSSGLGGQFSLTLISNWREWRIQKQFWSYCYSLGLMRPTSVDTQKTTMNFPVDIDCVENQIHATQKLFRPWTQDKYKR
jgi:hypothetical protein